MNSVSNDFTGEIAKVKGYLDATTDVLVVTHERPTFDSIGSTLALYLGLISLSKRVTVACPDPMTVGLSHFVGANKITTDIGKKNFIISLDYVDGSIEKVSYNIEGNKFNLVIEPRLGFEPFDATKVHYSQSSVNPQLVFVVDTIHLGGLKKLYEEQKELFAGKSIVNIDRHINNSNFGQTNIVDTAASSTAEVVAHVLSSIGVKLTTDIATNLLNALYQATNNFLLPTVSASAFELAAVCLKAGGKRFPVEVPPAWPATSPHRSVPAPMQQAAFPGQSHPAGPGQALPSSGQAPADWLKPKIFKSSNAS